MGSTLINSKSSQSPQVTHAKNSNASTINKLQWVFTGFTWSITLTYIITSSLLCYTKNVGVFLVVAPVVIDETFIPQQFCRSSICNLTFTHNNNNNKVSYEVA